jgi:alkylated DNA nucleotide flippase Atl1
MGHMRRELVFTAYPGRAELARRITLAEAGLRERADLQEWIRAHPQILGPGVRIVTYEFDRWISGSGSHGDRLDLLGLDEDGRLVLAELKRDGAPDTVEMQAIKYASYASRFKVDTLAACHADYLRRTLSDPSISDEDALAQLDEHCGGLDPEQLAAVRIVLVAGSFPEPVTSSVVWLCTQGRLDMTLIEVGAYQCANDIVISVSQLWPLPEVEELTVSPAAPTTKAAVPAGRRRTTTNAVASLAASGAVADGTELHLVPAGSYAGQVAQWVAEQPERGRAIWRAGERVKALEWPVDSGRYSASGLAEHIVKLAAGKETSIVGPEWWALEDGTTLAELAGTSPGRRDWTPLHQLLLELKPGEWATYGDLAEAIGSHAIAVGQHLTRCEEGENAYRVLGSDGRPRANFTWGDPTETRTCREVLEDEGVTFSSAGAADPAQRVATGQLRARLTAGGVEGHGSPSPTDLLSDPEQPRTT